MEFGRISKPNGDNSVVRTQAEKTSIAQGSGEAIRNKKPAKPVGGMDPLVAMEAMSDVNRIGGGNEGYQPHTATLRVRSTFD